MSEFGFRIRKMREQDYLKGKEKYIEELRKAAEPVKKAMKALEADLAEIKE